MSRTAAGFALAVAAIVCSVARAQESPPEQPPGESPTQPAAEAAPVYETIVRARRDDPQDLTTARVGRARIEREGARTAADVLEREPSLTATTGQRGERIITLRGFSQHQTAVLLDGAPAYIPYDGQMDLGMVPAELIDHITVVKGPGSVVFGPNGLGGSVNVVTRRPGEGPLADLLFESRDPQAYRLAGYHTLEQGPVAWQVYGGIDQSDSWPLSRSFTPTANEDGGDRNNSDASMVHAGAGLRVRAAPGHDVSLGALYLDGERGVPPSTVDFLPRYWRFTSWRMAGASLAHEGTEGPLGMDEMVWMRLYDNLLDAYDDATYATQDSPRAMHSQYRDQQVGGRVRLRYGVEAGHDTTVHLRLWTGAQHERHRHEPGPGMDPRTDSRTLITAAPEVEADVGEAWAFLGSFQVDVEVPGELPDGSLAARTGLGPLASVRWRPVHGLVLRVTGARRTRFPTLKERFSQALGYRKPNPTLGPEAAWHVGLDIAWRPTRWVTVSASAYDAEVSGLIERVSLGGGMDQLQNVGHARFLGIEAAVELGPVKGWETRLGYAFLHARRTDEDVAHPGLAYRPAHKATAEVAYAPLRWLEVATMLRVVGPRDYEDPETRQWGRLGTSASWDARIALRPTAWMDLWVRATNLLDSNHQSEYGFPDPGREVWFGVRLRMADSDPMAPLANGP